MLKGLSPPIILSGVSRQTDRQTDRTRQTDQDGQRLIMVGDFNCRRIDWSNYEVKKEEVKDWSWNKELFNLATQSLLHQHINEPTRMRGEDRPTILDLLFTRTEEEVTNIQYKTPLGNSNHVVLQFDFLVQYDVEDVKEKYKEDRLNYKRGNYEKVREVYKETDWKELEEIEDINKQYERFLELYNKGTEQCIPKAKEEKCEAPDWFNDRCREARDKKGFFWTRWNRHRTEPARERFLQARHEYTDIRREEDRKFEKGIIEKSVKEPKISYAHINSKMKLKNKLQRLRVDGEIHRSDKAMCEALNESFHTVFTKEEAWEEDIMEDEIEEGKRLNSISVSRTKVLKKSKELDKRKAMGPDEISCWVLRE